MLANSGKAATAVTLLKPASAADTAAATGTAVAVAEYEGDLMITQHVGVVTAGSIAGKIEMCDDAGGTNAEDVTGATFTSVTTSNDDPNIQKITIDSGSLARKFIRYKGTITTGPAVVSVEMHARKKYID